MELAMRVGILQIGEQVGEGAGHTQQDQHFAQGLHHVGEDNGKVTDLEALVDKQAHAQGPDHSAGGGFGGGKDTGDDAHDHEQNGQHAPDGATEGFDTGDGVKFAGGGNVMLAGARVGVDHQTRASTAPGT